MRTNPLRKLYEWIICIFNPFQNLFLLVFRLYWGWQFFMTGKGKLTNIAPVVEFFQSLGLPAPLFNAYLTGTVECLGGLMLVLGLGARLAAIPLTVVMIVAYATAHQAALFGIFSDPNEFFAQKPFLFLMTTLMVLFFGPGKLSIDELIRRRSR